MRKNMKRFLALVLTASMLNFNSVAWADMVNNDAPASPEEVVLVSEEAATEVEEATIEEVVVEEPATEETVVEASTEAYVDMPEEETEEVKVEASTTEEEEEVAEEVETEKSYDAANEQINVSTESVATDFNYTISNSVATITGYIGTSSTVSIPSTLGGYPVRTIKSYSFENNAVITSLTIPSSVTTIGYSAFRNCKNLRTITIATGTSNAVIDGYAFFGCDSLGTISIPKNYTDIGTHAFAECKSLSSATIANSGANYANQIIRDRAFQYCVSLTTVSIPSTVKTIGDGTFEGCALTSITIPAGVETLGSYLCQNCKALTSVTIPGTVTSIGYASFRYCDLLGTVTLREGTNDAKIESYAFANCPSIRTISIPKNYITIGDYSFLEDNSLMTVTIADSGKTYANQEIKQRAFQYCTSLTSVSIPKTVKTIGDGVFEKSALTSLTIPAGVESLGSYLCQNSKVLKSVSIPGTVTKIGYASFRYCDLLETVTIKQGTNDAVIENYAFANCPSIRTVSIPKNYTSIGSYSFLEDTGINSVVIADSGKVYANQEIKERAFQYCTSLSSVSIPKTVKTIGAAVFEKSALTSLTIPAGVESLGSYLCQNSKELKSVTIAGTVTSIGYASFRYCDRLTTVTLKEGSIDATIENYAFANCPSIVTITVPKNYVKIGDYSFNLDTNLTTLIYLDSGRVYANQTVGSHAFKECPSLVNVYLPGTLSEIGSYAFESIGVNAKVRFLGNAPSFHDYSFYNTTATCYYPVNNSTWVDTKKQQYHGTLTWLSWNPVTDTPVTSVSISNTSLYIQAGKTSQLTAHVNPAYAYYKNITWTSSNTAVATVSSTGVVTGVKRGTATITAKSNNGKVATCKVTVGFADVAYSSWYYTPVNWAVGKGITNGTSTNYFSPDTACTRAQIVTFLWNAAGQPKVSGVSNPFRDVKSTDWYYNAVLWAVSKKITNGTSATTFSPNSTCTRGQVVTFLWNWAGQPKTTNTIAFKDVSSTDFYYSAVRWAVAKKVTNGTTTTTFSPKDNCTRAQVVTFLYNYLH